jgi:hypothetical protein
MPNKYDLLMAEIARRGLKIEHYPCAVRVFGRGVDVRATRLALIDFADLRPPRTSEYRLRAGR